MPTINKTPVVPKRKRTVKMMPDRTYKAWKLYNTDRWRKMRQSKLMETPLCEVCSSRGLVVLADSVHHINEILNGENELEMQSIAYDYNNLLSICSTCHNRYHRLVQHGAKTKDDIEFLEAYNKAVKERKNKE